MPDRNLILTLAKVIAAAAWADGEVTLEEVNSIKDLLFYLPRAGYKQDTRLSAREWATLEMYIEMPISAEERARLVQELQDALRTPKDREFAIAALEDLGQADGNVTREEQAVLEDIKSALEQVDLNILVQLGRLIRGPVQRRNEAAAHGLDRERHLEDFIRNKVYYRVQQRMKASGKAWEIAEEDLRKLSLAGGLMARVAHVDRVVTENELDTMTEALRSGWDISEQAAAFVAEVAVSEVSADLDYYRLTREFTTNTKSKERARFLDVLFAVAQADGRLSHEANEEIRRISKSLNLSHRQFIDAKTRALRRA